MIGEALDFFARGACALEPIVFLILGGNADSPCASQRVLLFAREHKTAHGHAAVVHVVMAWAACWEMKAHGQAAMQHNAITREGFVFPAGWSPAAAAASDDFPSLVPGSRPANPAPPTYLIPGGRDKTLTLVTTCVLSPSGRSWASPPSASLCRCGSILL